MNGTESLYLGIDLGTGGVRAIAVNDQGKVAARAAVGWDSTAIIRNAGRHEQDPHAWWNAVSLALRQMTARLVSAGFDVQALAGLAVDGTSGTLLAVDRSQLPLGLAIMYNDPRAGNEAQDLNDVGRASCERLGYRFDSSFALSKILWIQRNRPGEFDSAWRFLHQADYIVARLCGDFSVSDYGNALKTGYDLVDECWPDWLDAAIPGVRERLPRVVAPGTVVGAVTSTAAAATGLPAGLPVIAGTTDGVAGCLASGLHRPGDYNTTLGTTLVFKGISRDLCRYPQGLIYSHKLPGGLWLPGAGSNTGGEWTNVLFAEADLQELDRAAEPVLPSRLVAYPLVRTGERFPFSDSAAVGFCVPSPANEIERYAAFLQGTAMVERLGYDVLDRVTGASGGAVYATGGGSRSDIWLQCRADATGRVYHRPACPESAFGSCILAASGSQSVELGSAVRRMVRVERTFSPCAERLTRYNRAYETFLEALRSRGYLSGPERPLSSAE